MAKGVYIGVQTPKTVTNLVGAIGDFESGTWNTYGSEGEYLAITSICKFGSRAIAFRQAAAATELTYTLRYGREMLYPLDNSHTYYASVWINQYNTLDITCDLYWPVGEPSIITGAKNTKVNEWQQHSVVFNRSSFTSGSYPIRIDVNNYPGNSRWTIFDGLMIVDLTAVFGAGNEPDKTWCDANIPFTTSTATVNRSVARKIKKMYVGVNGEARKVKKGYIGIGGVARPFFSSGIEYYGTITPLSEAKLDVAGIAFQNRAIFAGGMNTDRESTTSVDSYDQSLTKISLTELPGERHGIACATNGTYAIFAGGLRGSRILSSVVAYDTSFTRVIPSYLNGARAYLAGAGIGNYALFAGGEGSVGAYATVYPYSSSLTKESSKTLSFHANRLAGASNSQYAIFGGGANGSTTNPVNGVSAFNSSLTRTDPDTLSVARHSLTAVALGPQVIFAGGNTNGGSGYSTEVESYDESLSRQSLPSLTTARMNLASVSLTTAALLGGGRVSTGVTDSIEVYDTSLTKQEELHLSEGKCDLAAAKVGAYALFAGGDIDPQYVPTAVVDVYQE